MAMLHSLNVSSDDWRTSAEQDWAMAHTSLACILWLGNANTALHVSGLGFLLRIRQDHAVAPEILLWS